MCARSALLPYALANVVCGGTAEYAALWFKSSGLESGFYLYVAVAMAVAAVITSRLPDTNASDLILEG
jgi:MHS family alpha-ketoglutarate permease-like MFS transporter